MIRVRTAFAVGLAAAAHARTSASIEDPDPCWLSAVNRCGVLHLGATDTDWSGRCPVHQNYVNSET